MRKWAYWSQIGRHHSPYQIKLKEFRRFLHPQNLLLLKRRPFPSQMFRRWKILRLMRTKTSLSTLLQFVGGHHSKILVPQLVVPRPRAPAVIFAFHMRSYEVSRLLLSNLTVMERRCHPTLASMYSHPARGFLAQQALISTLTGLYPRKLKTS